jgi:hypothetical protein
VEITRIQVQSDSGIEKETSKADEAAIIRETADYFQ